MFARPIFERLRDRLDCLEETQRRFSRTISIADAVDSWMPNGGLPTGCIHEIKGTNLASPLTFSSILSVRIAGTRGNIVYISSDRSLHPVGLLPYGTRLDQFLLVSVRRTEDLAWAVMEALRCSQVSAVITVLNGLSLTDSRRLQLAAEKSGATGFFLGEDTSAPNAAPITRWKISPSTGQTGQRFDEPIWKLNLLYCRGGRPGSWTIEWRDQQLNTLSHQFAMQSMQQAFAG